MSGPAGVVPDSSGDELGGGPVGVLAGKPAGDLGHVVDILEQDDIAHCLRQLEV